MRGKRTSYLVLLLCVSASSVARAKSHGGDSGGTRDFQALGTTSSRGSENSGKLREAAESLNKKGPEFRQEITKASESFSTNVNKLMESAGKNFADLGKVFDSEQTKAGLEAIKTASEIPKRDPKVYDDMVSQIVGAYKELADLRMKKVAVDIAAALPPPIAPAPAPTPGQSISQALQASAGAGLATNALALAQQASNGRVNQLPQFANGTATHSSAGAPAAVGALSSGNLTPVSRGFTNVSAEQRAVQDGISRNGYRVPASFLRHSSVTH